MGTLVLGAASPYAVTERPRGASSILAVAAERERPLAPLELGLERCKAAQELAGGGTLVRCAAQARREPLGHGQRARVLGQGDQPARTAVVRAVLVDGLMLRGGIEQHLSRQELEGQTTERIDVRRHG